MAKPPRTERLLALALVLLNSRRALSRDEIRSAVLDYPADASPSAFERMFERDKDELRSMGIPIETVEIDGPGGHGYQLIHSQAFLDPIEADDQERLALAVASRVWQEATWGHAATHALRKLELVGGFEADKSIGFALSIPVDSAMLTTILQACDERREITFDYRTGETTNAAKRRVQPWGIVAARGNWYLVGHDLDRDDTRVFRTSRIAGDVTAGRKLGAFEPPAGIDLRDVASMSFPAQQADVVLRAQPGKAVSLRALAGGTDDPEFTITDANPELIAGEILRAGPSVQVISPPALRDSVIPKLEILAALPQAELTDGQRSALKKAADKASRAPIETSVEQLGRLLTIVPWLIANPGVTYQQAADHFGVDVSRLRHDLELAACTEFGSQLMTLDIDAWGTTLVVRNSQGIDAPLRFTQSEAISLLVALDLLTQIPGPFNRGAIETIAEKLRAATGSQADLTEHLVVDSALRPSSDLSVAFETIGAGLRERKALRLEYRSPTTDTISIRTVDPIGTFTTGGISYLRAWCRSADAIRNFRLDRIVIIELSDDALNVPGDLGPLDTRIDPAGTTTIVELDEAIAWWADQTPHTASVAGNGSLLVELNVANPEWAIRTVLGFGGRMRVAEPADLAVAVRARAETALAAYSRNL